MSVLPYIQGRSMNFVVATDGNVGIGTSQPQQKLHVMGDMYSTGTLTASNLVITGDYVFFNTITSNVDPFVITNFRDGPALTVSQAGVGNKYAIAEFYDLETGIALKIADGGNVGVGVANPTVKLHVAGDMRCDAIFGNASNVTGLAPSAKIDTTNATNITSGTLTKDVITNVMNPTSFLGSVGIGTTAATNGLDVFGGVSVAAPFFPPRPLTNILTTVSNNAITKFNGTYQVDASFDIGANGTRPFNAFDLSSSTNWVTANDYNPDFKGIFGVRVTVDASGTQYYGHWLQISLPTSIYMYTYSIRRPPNNVNTPASWILFGSVNGIQWYSLSQVTRYEWGTNVVSTFAVNSQTMYRIYRLVITECVTGSASLSAAILPELVFSGDTVPYIGFKVIGPLEVAPDANSSLLIVNSSNVGIGTRAPQEKLHIGAGAKVRVDALSGTGTRPVYVDQNGILTFSLSDERLKQNFSPMHYGLRDIERLNPVTFEWQDTQRFGAQKEIGLIAQEVKNVIPEVVAEISGCDEYTLDYSKLVPVLIQAVKELACELKELKKSCTSI